MTLKLWNWQATEWPHFSYNEDQMVQRFLLIYFVVGHALMVAIIGRPNFSLKANI